MASQNIGTRASQRISDPVNPMPPFGQLMPGELAVLQEWFSNEMPEGASCVSKPDAGVPQEVPDAGPSGEGLPCEVESLLAQNCRDCHGARPSAPFSLMGRAQFLGPAHSNQQMTMGAMTVQRLRHSTAPMPPSGQLSAQQIQTISDWVAQGMPQGSCQVTDAGPNPFDVAPQCSSGRFVALDSLGESEHLMNPGYACITCHRQVNANEGEEEGPAAIAGTVYPTAHEPSLCQSQLQAPAQVIITGADGMVFTLDVNEVGNFYLWSNPALRLPYRAKVRYQGRERAMATPQMSGDCNSCHTQNGFNGAPGRILAP